MPEGINNANVSPTYGYDNLNRLTSVTNATYNLSMALSYDAAGNRIQQVAKNGSSIVQTENFAYDANNRLVQLDENTLGTFRFAYDPMDRRTSLTYPTGITTSYAYDKAYRLTALVSKGSGAIADAWSYGYDAVGNRTTKTDMDGKLEAYTYDSVYRLTEARYAEGTHESFTYDAVGNRTTQVTETGQNLVYSYDVANQLLSAGGDTFTYDANGSTKTKTTSTGTTTFTYDIKNRLTAISGPEGSETNTYAPDGTRVRLNNAALYGDEKVLYDLGGNPIYSPNGYQRVYGPGTDELLAERRSDNNKRYHLHDALGSITASTDENGSLHLRRAYRPFGATTTTGTDSTGGGSSVFATRFGFTGREMSVGSTMNYRVRQYDGVYGRFLQQDEYHGNDNVPPSLHRYVYALNGSINYVDPSGYLSILGKGIGVLVFTSVLMTVIALHVDPYDKWAHIMAGFYLTMGVISFIAAWQVTLANAIIISVALTVIAGTISEATITGPFDIMDWLAQDLGMLMAAAVMHLLLGGFSVTEDIQVQLLWLATICIFGLFYPFIVRFWGAEAWKTRHQQLGAP